MKVAVIMNDDGHFEVAVLTDRAKVKNILELSDEGGDRTEDVVDGLDPYEQELWKNYRIISFEAWENIILNFEQRGTFEIVEI